ncbi:methyltransferase domain-containing protein [Salinarimonas soli]|uniref:Methyltransferase domain-containing protein n=2 Tax=Salinarimonas soli TaxID=1638099 RepID=A0A5B2VIC6_9HYPH|nr:methyltransferase domain-containing protein [Salinarimonas soli]
MPERRSNGGPSLLDRAYDWHDRLVANPRFQAFAQTFWLTRPIARRRAKELFDLAGGFIHSQVLLACVRLRLLDMVRAEPLPAEILCARAGLPPEAGRRLLEAAVGLRLLRRRGGALGLGTLGAALLGNPAALAMIEHHPLLYDDLADPVAAFSRGRGGGSLARYWGYAEAATPGELPEARTGPYTELMAASQPLVARQVLDAYPLGRHRTLLDVGGGGGAFLAAVRERAPQLGLMLFDLPAVAAKARAVLPEAGAGAVAIHEGDFTRDPLPRGADVISLVRIAHDHDDAVVLGLLRAIRAALPEDGTLLLAEPMAGTPGLGTLDAYFAVYLHALGTGRLRSAAELTDLLAQAGFGPVRRVRTAMPLLTGLLVATAH